MGSASRKLHVMRVELNFIGISFDKIWRFHFRKILEADIFRYDYVGIQTFLNLHGGVKMQLSSKY